MSTPAQYRSGLSRNRSLERDSEMLKHLVKFQVRAAQLRDDRGATAVEYGLMVALIAVAIIATVLALGGKLNTLFTQIAQRHLRIGLPTGRLRRSKPRQAWTAEPQQAGVHRQSSVCVPAQPERGNFEMLKTLVKSQVRVVRIGVNERGATAVEYGLMVALIAVAIIATVLALGGKLNTLFSDRVQRHLG